MIATLQLKESPECLQWLSSKLEETEGLTLKSRPSAQGLTPLINSVTSDFEARLLLQDSIDGIVRKAEAFISYLYCMVSTDKRNTLLSRYRELLKDMMSTNK